MSKFPAFAASRDASRFVAGVAAFDGSNPTSVAHGLNVALGAVVTLQGSSAPGDNTSQVTYNVNGDNIDFYAWKNTGGTDPTLVASTGTETFAYMIFGF